MGTMGSIREPAEKSPFITEFFMVEGRGFRGMAYSDSKGSWRSAYNHVLLPGKIRILG
jgi:hypothetical protein